MNYMLEDYDLHGFPKHAGDVYYSMKEAAGQLYTDVSGRIGTGGLTHPGSTDDSGWDDVIGITLQGVGGVMLLPGPGYMAAGAAGAAAFKHPAGFVVGVAGYLVAGALLVQTGSTLRELD